MPQKIPPSGVMDRFHTFPGAASPCVVSSDYMVIVHPFQILPRSIVGIHPFPRCVAPKVIQLNRSIVSLWCWCCGCCCDCGCCCGWWCWCCCHWRSLGWIGGRIGQSSLLRLPSYRSVVDIVVVVIVVVYDVDVDVDVVATWGGRIGQSSHLRLPSYRSDGLNPICDGLRISHLARAWTSTIIAIYPTLLPFIIAILPCYIIFKYPELPPPPKDHHGGNCQCQCCKFKPN